MSLSLFSPELPHRKSLSRNRYSPFREAVDNGIILFDDNVKSCLLWPLAQGQTVESEGNFANRAMSCLRCVSIVRNPPSNRDETSTPVSNRLLGALQGVQLVKNLASRAACSEKFQMFQIPNTLTSSDSGAGRSRPRPFRSDENHDASNDVDRFFPFDTF
jgi:hypothetical protein